MNRALDLVLQKLLGWGEGAVAMAPNFVVACFVLLLFWLLARVGRKVIQRALARAVEQDTISRLLASLAAFLLLGVGLFVALGVLNLDKTVTSLLAGAGVIGLTLGFAFQNLATNYLAGTLISLRGTYREGDLIETNGYYGKVDRVDLRVTRIRKPTGELVVVPNKDIFENSLVSHSATGERRVDIEVGVSYADDLETVRSVSLAAVSEVSTRIPDREVEFFFESFGSSSIACKVRFWIPFKRRADYLAARSEAIVLIRQAYDQNDITIPFPIETLDFGVKGGERLAEALMPRVASLPSA